jgi:hypothetical protein
MQWSPRPLLLARELDQTLPATPPLETKHGHTSSDQARNASTDDGAGHPYKLSADIDEPGLASGAREDVDCEECIGTATAGQLGEVGPVQTSSSESEREAIWRCAARSTTRSQVQTILEVAEAIGMKTTGILLQIASTETAGYAPKWPICRVLEKVRIRDRRATNYREQVVAERHILPTNNEGIVVVERDENVQCSVLVVGHRNRTEAAGLAGGATITTTTSTVVAGEDTAHNDVVGAGRTYHGRSRQQDHGR